MASYEEFTIDQGTDVAIEIHLTETDGSVKDLFGYSVDAKLKKNYNSTESVDFTAIVADPSEDGIVTISLTNDQTDSLKAGRYVYDVEISHQDSDGNVLIERVLEGRITVNPSVTR